MKPEKHQKSTNLLIFGVFPVLYKSLLMILNQVIRIFRLQPVIIKSVLKIVLPQFTFAQGALKNV